MAQNIEFTKAPKHFLENVNGGFSADHFILAMFSGTNGAVYALTPEHMKRLSQWMHHQVEQFEKKHHKIEAEWVPGTKSPIQSTDIGDKD